MSLEICQHLSRKLPDQATCAVLCEGFPACLPPSLLGEAVRVEGTTSLLVALPAEVAERARALYGPMA